MSWLSHLTGTKSPPQSGRASANKKKKTRDAMDTDEIDEGAFFWVPGEVDQSLLSKPPAYPSSSSSSASSSSSFSSSSSSSSGRSLFTLPSSSAQLSFSTTSDRYGDLAPAAAAASPAPSTDELPPPYPRGAAAALYPPVATAPSPSRPTSVVGACSTSAAYLRTQAYAPLQHCSFSLNPRLASVQSTPQSRAAVALLGQLKEMEDRLKQGPIYDPCFEAEVVVQAKQDREKQEDRMRSIECRYRKQRELIEAEAKRLQDIAITEWVEQQQRRREGDNQQPVSPGTEEGSLLDGSSLIDLSFSPRPPGRVVDHQPAKQHSDLTELPPPYPGPPLSQQPPPSSNASMPVHFPAPTASSSSSSSSSLFPSGSTVPSSSSPSPAGTAILHFPATPSQMLGHGSSSAGVLTRHPVYCVAPFAVAPPPLAFPRPPPPRSNIPTPFSAPHGTTLQPAAPNVAVQLPVKQGVPSPFSPPTQTATTSDAARLALVSAPPRVTMEEYQRKYPVLANPERRAIFIQLLEMKFKPEIIAMGLEVFPDNQPEKIVTFVANFHKLAEMGYPSERIKQSLLLHEDGDVQKAIVYLEELDSLLKAGLKESEIFDAFLLFDNDIQKAASFLTAHTALAQFGFDDLRIREALLMCDNNQEKAAQYLMMNT